MTDRLTTAIGTISGTSMDGIDIALIRTDGRSRVEPGPGRTLPYPTALRAALQELLADPSIAERDPLTELEARVTQAFGEAISAFLELEGIDPASVDLIGLHGQTVFHRPERRFTRQLGRGDLLAKALGVAVVDGFRQADVKSGGHGAPLAPLYHAAMVADLPKPVMVLNWGGVGNVTYIGQDEILAFDTGPASALIDDFMLRHFGLAFDADGATAARGRIDQAVLDRLLSNPFFAAKPPKSLDRQAFHAHAALVETLAPEDAVATLTAFTIAATAAAIAHVPQPPQRWLVGGGGRHNHSLMQGLAQALGVAVGPVEAEGWDGDQIEAQLFGYLAVRSRLGLPLSLPTTTGVPYPMPGGAFWPAS
ncbi:MAG: anhydro-N-acetylmuramic acid kinase [Bosea sp. (in: a-proteobacteria)]